MIKNLKFVTKNNVILSGNLDDKKFDILFSDVYPYWNYSTEEDFEGGTARIYNNKVLFAMTTASGQGGVIVLWNAETQKIEHVSDGAYCEKVCMDDQKIYSLCDVCNFVTKSHCIVCESVIGEMDAWKEAESIEYESDVNLAEIIHDYSDVELNKNKENFIVTVKDKNYILKVKSDI